MELIRRYVYAVGQFLPDATRKEVQTELLDLLQSELEDRASATGRTPDELMAMDVLREFGDPAEVASRYAPRPRYLIGPRLYPAFIRTLKTIAILSAALFSAILIFGLPASPLRLSDAYGFPQVWRAAMGALGMAWNYAWIAFWVFVVIERVVYAEQIKLPSAEPRPWDPHTLPPLPNSGTFAISQEVSELVSCVFALYVANAYLPLLPAGFNAHLPLLNVCWIAAFLLHAIVLLKGRWSRALRWAELGAGALLGFASAWVIASNPLPSFGHLKSAGSEPIAIAVLSEGLVLLIAGAIVIFETLRAGFRLYRLLKPKEEPMSWIPTEPAPAFRSGEG
jgi:hypothetical protein